MRGMGLLVIVLLIFMIDPVIGIYGTRRTMIPGNIRSGIQTGLSRREAASEDRMEEESDDVTKDVNAAAEAETKQATKTAKHINNAIEEALTVEHTKHGMFYVKLIRLEQQMIVSRCEVLYALLKKFDMKTPKDSPLIKACDDNRHNYITYEYLFCPERYGGNRRRVSVLYTEHVKEPEGSVYKSWDTRARVFCIKPPVWGSLCSVHSWSKALQSNLTPLEKAKANSYMIQYGQWDIITMICTRVYISEYELMAFDLSPENSEAAKHLPESIGECKGWQPSKAVGIEQLQQHMQNAVKVAKADVKPERRGWHLKHVK